MNIFKQNGDSLILSDVSLANLTSWRVGGLAQWYTAPRNWQELAAAFTWYNDQDLPLTLLGAGSNLLVSDRGIPGLILSTRHWRYLDFDEATAQVTVSAGEPIARVAWQAAKRGWRGLEWAVGIPGTVGGAVVMNAGAHGKAIADCLLQAKVISPQGNLEILQPEMLGYKYRYSLLQLEQKLVLDATLQLQPGFAKEVVRAETTRNLQQRKQSQPYDRPSCGSVFRNPPGFAAGWLIEQLGLKGYQIGEAQVAHRHANFILNCGQATASEIFQLIGYVQGKVEEQWGITLETEVKLVGEF
ncbi:UDP-N-acetylmuramate dehydrogenase [Gloeocapsa sp. PCC 73106]|uniref:UDP-N-acetylmuramate dehydrogenase n=1 Tax=Gloeocapsa sp. PCC 73106 TaxID=102232 RepID=UPI0002AC7782|nr:UDP-N-acetylmuramate dehydrogenase [Gloeocapsa sp. PCC 73106]ELR98917.1 UDP-N-acetylmuramate dehydrogenase [Gloeocapsa sp. PCC 73106]